MLLYWDPRLWTAHCCVDALGRQTRKRALEHRSHSEVFSSSPSLLRFYLRICQTRRSFPSLDISNRIAHISEYIMPMSFYLNISGRSSTRPEFLHFQSFPFKFATSVTPGVPGLYICCCTMLALIWHKRQ